MKIARTYRIGKDTDETIKALAKLRDISEAAVIDEWAKNAVAGLERIAKPDTPKGRAAAAMDQMIYGVGVVRTDLAPILKPNGKL